MTIDDLIRDAAAEAEQAPGLSEDERAPFEHLRDEFLAIMRTAQQDGEQRPSLAAGAAQMLFSLRRTAFELIEGSLSLAPLPVSVAARAISDNAGNVSDAVRWTLGDGLEVRLWVHSDTPMQAAATGHLYVDILHEGWQQRPFYASLLGVSGDLVQPEVGCEWLGSFAVLEIPENGDYVVRVKHLEKEYLLQFGLVD